MSTYDIKEKLGLYRQTCRRGTDWLLGYMNADGSIGPATQRMYYYRVPWALALMGEITAANRVLDWIKQNMFSSQGAIQGVTPLGVFEERYGSYPIACLLVGGVFLQRFDFVYPGTQHLLTWQDPVSGGFYNTLTNRSDETEQELFPTAQGGMTCLLAGELEAASKAGAWMKRLWELQPDVENKLYAVYTPAQGLVTDFAPEIAHVYVTRKDDPWQYHYNGGIAAAFLSQLYLATGDPEWLALARKYQNFSMTTDECQFQSMQTCKSGWGAGLLYVATREKTYRDWTVRMGDWFVKNQYTDGRWENTKHWNPTPDNADNIEVTAEMVMHVAHLIAYLSV